MIHWLQGEWRNGKDLDDVDHLWMTKGQEEESRAEMLLFARVRGEDKKMPSTSTGASSFT